MCDDCWCTLTHLPPSEKSNGYLNMMQSEIQGFLKRRWRNVGNTQHTQKSFSTFCKEVPSWLAVAKNKPRRSLGVAAMTERKPGFMFAPPFPGASMPVAL